ncbi:MAG: PAS domain-containing protein [Sphingomonas sp.]
MNDGHADLRVTQLIDENEQLRTALESVLEENTRLATEHDRLQRRTKLLSEELHVARAAPIALASHELLNDTDELHHTEEELRAAFEELQVLTEELEVANSSLQHNNEQLDARIEERSRQIGEISSALRNAEASLSTVGDLVPDLLWRTDPDGSAVWFNRRWFDFTADAPHEPLGSGWLEAVHPADRGPARAAWQMAVNGSASYHREVRIRSAVGDFRWFLVRAEPIYDQQDRLASWYAAATDIHVHRSAMEALQRSELRFRTLIEGIPQLVWRAIDGGKWTWASPQWIDYTGQAEEQARVMGWLRAFHPDDQPAARAAWERAPDLGYLEIEGRLFHASEGRYRHFKTRALPVTDDSGRIVEWLGTCTDVDDMLQLQQQQSVLVAELQHRTRNLMAVVRSIMARTLKESGSLDDFTAAIDPRLKALARVQSLLSRRESATRVTFDALLRDELSAHVDLDASGAGAQVTMSGPPDIALRSGLVQTLALALHELATNAVRHGALAHPHGRLAISWQLTEPAEGDHRLLIDWRESGVPDVEGERCSGDGYGRELIERALPYQLGAATSYKRKRRFGPTLRA